MECVVPNKLIPAEEGIEISEFQKFMTGKIIDEALVQKLHKEEKIFVDNERIRFKNFCGFLDKEFSILVIPKKLISIWQLEEKEFEEQKQIFVHKFNLFLRKILEGFSKLNIIYFLSLAKFPVKEHITLEENLIFKLLVLLSLEKKIDEFMSWIISNPHKELIKITQLKTASEVSDLDLSALIDALQNPHRWIKSKSEPIPTKVLQNEYLEIADTAENRFVKRFLEEILDIFLILEKEFPDLPIPLLKAKFSQHLLFSFLREVGTLKRIPYQSKVLQTKAGYRELFKFWFLIHSSFIPSFFSRLNLIFSLKDFAALWEYYTLLKLLNALKEQWGDFELKFWIEKERKIKGKYVSYDEAFFEFPDNKTLRFQPTLKSYSKLEFRPDFMIEFNDKRIIFDAKFRFMEGEAKREILTNLHYYRDALQVNSCIALNISNGTLEGKFYLCNRETKTLTNKSLTNIIYEITNLALDGNGIGYISLPIKES